MSNQWIDQTSFERDCEYLPDADVRLLGKDVMMAPQLVVDDSNEPRANPYFRSELGIRKASPKTAVTSVCLSLPTIFVSIPVVLDPKIDIGSLYMSALDRYRVSNRGS